jgi:putative sterol carrier protein
MSDLSIETVMNNTPKVFKPEMAEGVDAVVQFHFTGDEASDWVVTIKNGECGVQEGINAAPNMTMTVDSQDYLDIVSGKKNAMQAFMQGKVKVSGDMALAMKFSSFFEMG